MKNFKMLGLAAALFMVTGLAIAKKPFVLTQQLYESSNQSNPASGSPHQLTTQATLNGFTDVPTGSGQQATITNQSGTPFYVFAFNGSTYTALYAATF